MVGGVINSAFTPEVYRHEGPELDPAMGTCYGK